MLISKIRKDDDKFKAYHITAQEIQKIFNIPEKNCYRDLRAVSKELHKQILTFKNKKGTTTDYSFLTASEYEDGEGWVNLEINYHLKPFLLDLQKQFTQIEYTQILNFKHKYSYDLLLFLHSKLHREEEEYYFDIEISDLVKILGAPKSYKDWKTLRFHILSKIEKELKEKSTIKFTVTKPRTSSLLTFKVMKNWKYINEQEDKERKEELEKVENELPNMPPAETTILDDFFISLRRFDYFPINKHKKNISLICDNDTKLKLMAKGLAHEIKEQKNPLKLIRYILKSEKAISEMIGKGFFIEQKEKAKSKITKIESQKQAAEKESKLKKQAKDNLDWWNNLTIRKQKIYLQDYNNTSILEDVSSSDIAIMKAIN